MKLSLLLPGLLLLPLLIGCTKQEDSPLAPAPPFESQWRSRLSNLVFGTTVFDTVQVEVLAVSPQAVDSVIGVVITSLGQNVATFHLYDDASAFLRSDAPDFASSRSGDLVANNGYFTRLINSRFADSAGTYYIAVQAWRDHEIAWTPQDTIIISLSLPPQISNLNLPDTLYSGFSPYQISLQAFDPDAAFGDSVVSVQMTLYTNSGTPLGDPMPLTALDQINFGHTISGDFAVGLDSNFYTFAFRAYDTFNLISDSLGKSVYIENRPPYLADPVLPDTVIKPQSGSINFLITVRTWDDQTVLDINDVELRSLKPDGQWSNNGNPFPMFDNGLPFVDSLWASGYAGDEAAGDSIYTMTAFMDTNAQLGQYHFYLRASDLAGYENEIIDSLWVVP
jgi:hypothetical protein